MMANKVLAKANHQHLSGGRNGGRRCGLLLSLFAAGLAWGVTVQAAQPLGCLIEPRLVVELGSPVIGVLDEVLVERGATVRKGQVLARLRADVEKAAANAARSRAQAEADVTAARANRDFTRQRLVRAEDLVKKNFIAVQALDQAKTEHDVAEQKLAQAIEQKRIWDHEHQQARAQLSLRSLTSPINGVVVDRYLSPGERVEDKPVLKLADTNPLRVEVFMPAASYRDVEAGMSAKVFPDLPNAGEHAAKVVLVDRIIDPASNTFRVRLELPNPGNALPAGLRCKVALGEAVAEAANIAPAKAAVVVAVAPKAVEPATDAEEAVLAAVENWRKAWASKNIDGYLAAYAPEFHGTSPGREAWTKRREARLRQEGEVEVQLSAVKVRMLSATRARVQFMQKYQSAGFSDEARKYLTLVLRDGRWLIEEEQTAEPRG